MTKKSFNNSSDKHIILIQKLQNEIEELQQSQDSNNTSFKKSILQEASSILANYREESENPSRLLDLYFTMNSVIRKLVKAQNDEDFKKEILSFLAKRETLLCGDSHDYCFSNTLANQFCVSLVKKVFPGQTPLNILLNNVLTKDRKQPWENLYTFEADLPESSHFYRTKNNEIQLYEGIIQQAIGELKLGTFNPEQVWIGNDPKNGKNLPLSAEDLHIISQRSPTFKKIIDYVNQLNDYERNIHHASDAYHQLVNLRIGLSKGSSSGVAHSPAHIAVGKFSDWWWKLPEEIRNQINATDHSLSNFITQVLTQHDYCVHGASANLDTILHVRNIREKLNLIAKKNDTRVSNEELDAWHATIISELESTPPNITTDKDAFQIFSQCDSFMDEYIHSDLLLENDLFSEKNSNSLKNTLLNAKTEEAFVKPYLALNALINFSNHRDYAFNLLNQMVNNADNPHDLIQVLNKLFEMEEKNPTLIRKTKENLVEHFKGYQWKGHKVSHEWANLMSHAKKKILELSRHHLFSEDDDIKRFLKTSTGRWYALFHLSPSAMKYELRQKQLQPKIHHP